jgi:hypothetical protein
MVSAMADVSPIQGEANLAMFKMATLEEYSSARTWELTYMSTYVVAG